MSYSSTGDNTQNMDDIHTNPSENDEILGGSQNSPMEEVNLSNEHSSEQTSSKGKLRSPYWAHFNIIIKDAKKRAECKHCKVDVCAESKSGTSVLKNHLFRCKEYPPNIDRRQRLLSFKAKEQVVDESGICEKRAKFELWKFKQEDARKALAKMIILDELPFRFVEREGFRHFISVAQPNFIIPSRTTITRDCFRLYLDEKKSLKSFLSKCTSRISLTTDTWTSCKNLSYMCLTAHFIDSKWKLHKRILSFCPISGHSGELIGKGVEKCLLEWGISNVLTVTMDNASSNDVGVEYLKNRFIRWESTVLDGRLLHMRCAAHILSLIVKEGLKESDEAIQKVRYAVRYVRSSPARLQKFKSCVKTEKIESKSFLCLDVETRWNSTYLMLESALIFRKAFDSLASLNDKFKKEMDKHLGVPNKDDWDRVASLLPFLKIFYDATLRLSGSLYVTTNAYLQELLGIGVMIKKKCESQDGNVRLMAYGMKKKHEKYWENINNINLLLYIAVILDPRRKMQYVNWAINQQYELTKSESLRSKVKETLEELYDAYAKQQPQNEQNNSESIDLTRKELDNMDDVNELMELEFEKEASAHGVLDKKSELVKYLEEDREISPKNFDVLEWWKKNGERFPILALMARDILAVPVSTVASESAFSTSGRVLDSFRSSLSLLEWWKL